MKTKNLILIAVICFKASAATTVVPSMSRADFVTYFNAASAGDTLQFPAGTADWASGITINKAIKLEYQEGTSIIRNTSGGENTWIFTIDTPSADDNVRITGLTIFGVSSGGNAQGSGIFVDNDQRNVRIDNCHFSNMRRHAVQFVGYQAWGLIDHCSFTNCYTAIEANGGDNTSWLEANNYGPGTTNAVVVEDCYFENNDDSLVTDLNNTIYVSNGGRVDMRNCTVEGIGTEQNLVFWDSHGNNSQEPWDGNSLRGTVWASISNVVINVDASYRHFYIRGGMHVFAKVTITGPGGAAVISLTEEEAWADFSYPNILTTWPAPDQITNTWITEVTVNSVALTQARVENEFGDNNATDPADQDNDEVFIQHGRDFFMTNLVSNIPAFSTDHPTISGGIYGVAWLVYPHPRVTAEGGGGGGSSSYVGSHKNSGNKRISGNLIYR